MIAEDLTDGRLVLKTISRNLAIDEGGSLAFYDRSGLERLFCVSGTPPDHGIHVYADQASRRTLLRLICRHAVDLYHLIEVYDPEHDEVVGFVHRDGMRSTVREQWAIEGPDREAVICRVEETETVRHLLRYLLGEHIPSSYHGTVQGRTAFKLTRGLDAGGLDSMAVDFLPGLGDCLDVRLGLAAALCLFVYSHKFGLLWRLAVGFPRLTPR